MAEELLKISFDSRPYRLEQVELEGRGPFLAICGSKKDSRHCGGGIAIPGLQNLYGICNLIDQIAFLEVDDGETETKVSCFFYRNSILCGETRFFRGNCFYRIKKVCQLFL